MPTNTPKLALPGSVVQGEAPGVWHAYWNQICLNLETRLTKTGTADPNTAEVGHFVGQFYVRTGAERDIYTCSALGTPDPAVDPADWVSLFHDPATFQRVVRGVYSVLTTAAGAVTPDFSLSNFFALTLTENSTINNPTNVSGGGIYLVQITQDGATAFTLAWGAKFLFPTGTPETLVPGARKLFTFLCASNGDLICVPELGTLAPRSSFDNVRATQTATATLSSSEIVVPGLDNLPIPLADGVRRYQLFLDLPFRWTSADFNCDVRVRCGPLGTLADPQIFFRNHAVFAATSNIVPFNVCAFSYVPAAGDKLTVSVERSGGAGGDVSVLPTLSDPAGQLIFRELV